MNEAFERFKALADKKKNVYDEDLIALVAEEPARAAAAATSSLDLNVDVVEHGGAARARDASGSTARSATSAATGDGMVDACYKAIARIVGAQPALERYAVKAITGGTDAQGEVIVLGPRRRHHGRRAGRPHRHHHGERARLRERAQQARVPASPSAARAARGAVTMQRATIAVFPGDGIGPEVTAQARACSRCVPNATGCSSRSSKVSSVAAPSIATVRRCRRRARARQDQRCRAARRRRRAEVGQPAEHRAAGTGAARVAPQPRAVRQPTADRRASGADRRRTAQARAARGGRHSLRARAHRRHLLRPAERAARRAARPRGGRYHGVLRGRGARA